MKKVLLFGALVALLCGCDNAQTTQTNGIVADSLDNATTVRYLDAMPADFNEDDVFGFILKYGGYDMIVDAWQMSDGDWLIPYHWCAEEDGGTYFEEDEAGNQIEVVYKDPFEGKPYPVIHNPHFSFLTRNYGSDTINFYKAPDSEEVACTINYPLRWLCGGGRGWFRDCLRVAQSDHRHRQPQFGQRPMAHTSV